MTSTVYIAKNVYGGDGLGRLGDGRVVFVPGAWAGEQVRAEFVEEKRHFVKARLVEVVEPSADRIDGGALAGVPGCVYANLSAAGERKAKDAQLREAFDRARLLPAGDPRFAPAPSGGASVASSRGEEGTGGPPSPRGATAREEPRVTATVGVRPFRAQWKPPPD